MSGPAVRQRGFTLFDIVIVLAIVAAVMSMVVPQLRDTTYVRLLAAAEIVTSDLELAQTISVGTPDDPIVVVFETDPTPQYWLARSSDVATPIVLDGRPYRVTFGQGRARHIDGVTASCTPSGFVAYDAMGAIADFTEPVVTLTSGTRRIRLEISTTGTIRQVGD